MTKPVIDTHHYYPTEALTDAFLSTTEPPRLITVGSLINSFDPRAVYGHGKAVHFEHAHVLGLTPELLDLNLHFKHLDRISHYSLLIDIGYACATTSATLGTISSDTYQRYADFKLALPNIGRVLPFINAHVDYKARRLKPCSSGGAPVAPQSEYVRRLYTDTACASVPALLMAIDVFGLEHVMLGSAYPYWDVHTSSGVMTDLQVSETVMDDISSQTAQQLFGLALASPICVAAQDA